MTFWYLQANLTSGFIINDSNTGKKKKKKEADILVISSISNWERLKSKIICLGSKSIFKFSY